MAFPCKPSCPAGVEEGGRPGSGVGRGARTLSMLPGPPKHHSFVRLSMCSLCKPVTVESQLVDLSIFTFSPFTSSNSWHVPGFWVTPILLPLSIPLALLSLGRQGLLRPRLNIACPEKPFPTISTLCKFMALCSCPSLIELLAHVFFSLGVCG